MIINAILTVLFLQRINTPNNYESIFTDDSVASERVLIGYCSLDVVSCGEWEEGEFTAYSSGDGFTPSNTMASGKKVYEGAIACPSGYEFGDKIEIEGLGTYVCQDRMAKRFRNGNYFDVYMDSVIEAKEFGRQKLNFKKKQ